MKVEVDTVPPVLSLPPIREDDENSLDSEPGASNSPLMSIAPRSLMTSPARNNLRTLNRLT